MVGDLLDLETELENIAQGFNQLQNIPSMPEDSWPSTAAPNGVAFPVQTATDPFGNSFHSVPASNGHIANGQPQFFQTPMQQNQSWAGFSTPQPHTNGLFNNGMVGNGLNTSPPFSVSFIFIVKNRKFCRYSTIFYEFFNFFYEFFDFFYFFAFL